jgi:mono/diheme cytochrome c family protein
MRIVYLLVVASLAGSTALSAQNSEELAEGVTAAMISAGEQLYQGAGLCFACHAPDAKGMPGVGPNLTDEEWLQSTGTFPEIVQTILEGVPADKTTSGVVMLPKGGSQITEEQVRQVASYVWSLGPRNLSPGTVSPGVPLIQ